MSHINLLSCALADGVNKVCLYGEVAQLVEARILESRMRFAQQFSLGLENPLVVGSIPTLTIVIKYANSKSSGYAQR